MIERILSTVLGLRRVLVVALAVATVLPSLALSGHAVAAELRVSEVWCLQPGNRTLVVRTAVAEGLGSAKGDNGGIFLPNGSEAGPLNIDEWQQQRPAEFGRVCDKTYEALTGNPARGPASQDSGGVSEGEEIAIEVGAPLVAGFAGVAAGYGATKLTQRDERRYQRAFALAEGLGNLNAQLKALSALYEEGRAEEQHWTEAAKQVHELQSKIPASPEVEATASKRCLDELLKLLVYVEPGEGKVRAKSLREAGQKVNGKVGELIGALSADATLGGRGKSA